MFAIGIAFLHGGKQGGWVWDGVRAAIAAQTQGEPPEMLALDVPGCGTKRGRDTGALALADVVDELAGDLDRFAPQRIMLVGHSQAGTVLPRLAAARRDRIAELVYCACSIPLEHQTLVAMLGSGLQGARDDEVGWPLDPATTSPDALFATMFCNDMDADESSAFLARLGRDDWPVACATTDSHWGAERVRDIPATYVIALRDNILIPPWQRRFAERLGSSRTVSVDAGHQLLQTRPQAVAEILLAELKALG